MMVLWSFLLRQFGLGKIVAIGAIVTALISGLGGAYVKGRYDCASKYQLAEQSKTIRALSKQLADREDEQNFSNELFNNFSTIESANDVVEARLKAQSVSGCVDADWLRVLTELE